MIEDDWGGAYSEIDIRADYADGRPSREMRGVMVCNRSGLLSAKTTARPELGIKAGYNVFVNTGECQRLGLDPAAVMRDQAPKECLLHLGQNPGGVTITRLTAEDPAETIDRIAQAIALEHGQTVADYWRRYKTSDRADEAEDEYAAQCLRDAGY